MVYHRGLRLRALLYGEEFQKGIAKATNAIRISLVALEESSFVSNKEFYQLGWYTLYQKKIHVVMLQNVCNTNLCEFQFTRCLLYVLFYFEYVLFYSKRINSFHPMR